MSLALAAVGAVAAALLELTVIPYLAIGGTFPHPVLVFGIVVAIATGIEAGLTWAFVGGIALDVLAQRPLGASAFALLIAIGGAAAVAAGFGRFRLLAPIVTTAAFSLVYTMTLLTLYAALRGPSPLPDPVGTVLPGAVYDAIVAAIVGPLAVTIAIRRRAADRVDW